jgi:hypothetical protein
MLAVISLLGVLPMAFAGTIHPHVGMHVMSRPKPVASKAASVILAKPHKISWLDRVAVGIVLSEQATPLFSQNSQLPPHITSTWMKDVANFAVAHKRSHCAKHLSKKRCSDYRELYVMQDLVKTFPEAEWYFLTNEKDWIDWDAIEKIVHPLSPMNPLMVGYNEVGSGCKIARGQAHGFKNGLFMLSKAAALRFVETIALKSSEYEYLELNGCVPENLNAWGRKSDLQFQEKCSSGKDIEHVKSSWKRCQKLVDSKETVNGKIFNEIHSKTCRSDKLIDDFGGWTVYYSGKYDAMKQRNDPRHLLSFWGKESQVDRKAWYCFKEDRTAFPHGAISRAGDLQEHSWSKNLRDSTFGYAANELTKGKPFILGWPCSKQLITALDCLKKYKSLHSRACDHEIYWCCSPRVPRTEKKLDSKCKAAKQETARLKAAAPTSAPTHLMNFIIHDSNKVSCSDAQKSKEGDKIRYHYNTNNFNSGEHVATGDMAGILADKTGWIKGLVMGLTGMCKGQKRHLLIPRNLAWGDHPVSSSTEGPIVSDVELLDILHHA